MLFTVENPINRKILVAARLRQSVLHKSNVVVEAQSVNHGGSSGSTGYRRKLCHSIATSAIFRFCPFTQPLLRICLKTSRAAAAADASRRRVLARVLLKPHGCSVILSYSVSGI
jgi:hypothetical protein